ncbi:MAG TPA: hypothetical protein VMG98_10355 [Verrucomicrobiae bacterium]|nr:hypothetical protein [Verrucomicrobiae bacterium]
MFALFSWLGLRKGVEPKPESVVPNHAEALQRECADLAARLAEKEGLVRERGEALYELQQHYASEHFQLQRCMRDLKIERMRNAGAFGALYTTMERARTLQARIAKLKDRLRQFEPVEDEHFDTEPIRIQEPKPDAEP